MKTSGTAAIFLSGQFNEVRFGAVSVVRAAFIPALAAAMLVIVGCAPKSIASGEGMTATAPQYRLKTSDSIKVSTFGEPTLSGDYRIAEDGTISLPLAGPVRAAGLTIPELEALVTSRFAAYVRSPVVAVDLVAARPFYVMGEVKTPGEYPYSNGMTVLNAVAKAGGFTYRASQGRVFIHRSGEAKESRITLTVTTPVFPGDTIRIPERRF